MEENPDNYTLIQNFDNNTVDSLDMHLLPRIFWDILFSSMIFVAVVGNLIVLWIVTSKISKDKEIETKRRGLKKALRGLEFQFICKCVHRRFMERLECNK